MQKIKVLHFITGLDEMSGGPTRSVSLLATGQAKIGLDVTIMTIRTANITLDALRNTAVRVVVLEPTYSIREVETFICQNNINLVQLQSIWAPQYHSVAKLCRRLSIPYIITPRGMLEPWSLQQKWFKKKLALMLYQKADLSKAACIHTTAVMEARNVRNIGIKAPIAVIPNGINTETYPLRSISQKPLQQVLFLSRIHPKKGLDLLIDVWARLPERLHNWKLLIVGNGEEAYIQSLKDKVSALKLNNSVEIHPPIFGKAKIDMYHNSSLFVLPSYSENFGMVIAEAMCCGVPVITTDTTPWPWLDETGTGWSINLTPDNLLHALTHAMDLPAETLFDMGQKGSLEVNKRFNYLQVARQTEELYRWILTREHRPDFLRNDM